MELNETPDLTIEQVELEVSKVDNANWSYVNILYTKSQKFLCCTSS